MSNEEMLATLMTINMALVEIMEIKNEQIKGLKIANLGLFVSSESKKLIEKMDLEKEES